MAFTKMGNFSFNHSGQPETLPYAAEDAQSKFDSRGNELKSILNAAIDLLNSAADGNSGADNVGMTPIAETGTNATVQSIVEALITRLKATEDGASGADLIGSTAIGGVTGTTVQAQMESMKGLVDGKAASDDLSGLAGTGRTTETVKGNADDLAAHLADYASKFPNNAGAHNSIYRGKNLGTSVTTKQYTDISNGTFEDMYIGDYWTINSTVYRIAAFNYYMQKGDTATTVNHITLVPDTSLYNHGMNDTDITTGGYMGSKMYTTGLAQAKTTIKNAFSGHVLKHRKLLSNATTDGKASGWAWGDSEVDLMNEVMVYGSTVCGESTVGGSGYNIGEEMSQLPLFVFRPDMISANRQYFWLRDVVSASHFASVLSNGSAITYNASSAYGVRPAFSIS